MAQALAANNPYLVNNLASKYYLFLLLKISIQYKMK